MAKASSPFALLADPSAALAAHDAMPKGRVVDKLQVTREDADEDDRQRNARWYAAKREQAQRLGISVRALLGRTAR